MEIILIRHGESQADILNVHEGRADFPLTDKGIEQVKRMSDRVLCEFPPEKIWASTLQRAKKTAEILGGVCHCPVEYLPDLMEQNNGDLAGRPLAELEDPISLLPHEKLGNIGESAIAFRMRAEAVFSYIKKESTSHKRIAIVTHGGMISRLIESFLKLSAIHNVYFFTGDTGIYYLEYTERGRLIRFMNSTTHL
ncbi:histidine phosphatase family protein [Shouchella lonarensis]|uniref:2,3-bisphosphoglycerate-dependent phosphoglycerate mutase n=1 Tax=Shouchella lonarensis TaxID=1464122 RepID=A0A1G6NFP9_9BACI|nr:histidine phosphatase family protein [Shouchella lonarensis]SDC66690.1 2,3-bisphosphoglycerate-dependent phosphoglycerate mutase [Shouchella lonarensis]